MSRRFLELAVRARRLVTPASRRAAPDGLRPATRRHVGRALTQFSFRLAFMIDLACVSLGALGGAAIGRATSAPNDEQPTACSAALRVLAGFRRAE
jgi:hypothetical protein